MVAHAGTHPDHQSIAIIGSGSRGAWQRKLSGRAKHRVKKNIGQTGLPGM
jgi:hypothetical protein